MIEIHIIRFQKFVLSSLLSYFRILIYKFVFFRQRNFVTVGKYTSMYPKFIPSLYTTLIQSLSFSLSYIHPISISPGLTTSSSAGAVIEPIVTTIPSCFPSSNLSQSMSSTANQNLEQRSLSGSANNNNSSSPSAPSSNNLVAVNT